MVTNPEWQEVEHGALRRCEVILCPEEEGGFSAHCCNLMGVVSQGDTAEEALENISDCFREAIAYYRDSGEKIPWGSVEVDRPQGSLHRWLEVSM